MLTLKAVNKEIKKLGFDCELVKGKDYFYFHGCAVDLSQDTSVYVSTLNQLTLDEWIEELRDKLGS